MGSDAFEVVRPQPFVGGSASHLAVPAVPPGPSRKPRRVLWSSGRRGLRSAQTLPLVLGTAKPGRNLEEWVGLEGTEAFAFKRLMRSRVSALRVPVGLYG